MRNDLSAWAARALDNHAGRIDSAGQILMGLGVALAIIGFLVGTTWLLTSAGVALGLVALSWMALGVLRLAADAELRRDGERRV